MNGFGMMLGALLCGASLTAGAASVASAPAQMDEKVCLRADGLSSAATMSHAACKDATASGASSHLDWQYALHRSQLYLYNPERVERLARTGERPTVEQ
jgi:hypothetical protein